MARWRRRSSASTTSPRSSSAPRGQGRIHHIEGLDLIRRELGPALVWENLLPVGAERRNWLQTLVSDGFILLRHPDLQRTLELADLVGSRLHLYAS